MKEDRGRPPITHVAIRFRETVYSLPRPNRHYDVIREILRKNPDVSHVDSLGDDQGFLDESGRFLTRKQALISAQLNDQIKADSKVFPHHGLYSENLW